MRISATPLRTAVLIAALVVPAVIPAGAQPKKKQVKDQGEQDLYNQAIHAGDAAEQIQALGVWTARFPDSDFKDDRLYFYMQAYSRTTPPEPAKVLDYGGALMRRDLRTLFPGAEGGLIMLNVWFLVVRSVMELPVASAEQLALGRKAAQDLLLFLPAFKPPNTNEAEWTAARTDIEQRTRAAIPAMALAPGNQAMAKTPPDCAAAGTLYLKAVEEYPDHAPAAYSLGKALYCQGLVPAAIFQFLRATELDRKEFGDYAEKLYIAYHGAADGLDAVRALAKSALQPPADFEIITGTQAADRKREEFARDFPHLARWNGIREHLAAPYGAQYFEGQVKGAAVSLKGAVVEGRPACRPKELLVAIGEGSAPEILIRLDSPLAGTAAAGEIEFTAVPRAFTREPFLLTMDAERAKIVNLKIGPCPQP